MTLNEIFYRGIGILTAGFLVFAALVKTGLIKLPCFGL